ncbi:protein Brevis radix-like 4 isoform X2 [Aegilops tauschii subsp. strangulata]|uniref:protein Brevis radix-like 4 isoform X2 n=1 Tax=Aegilops tauschii subsp. strangulata TaxID=200361 RepID=UPI00098B30A0|nr:protein Brevis radix-like 4 isoform X2 [Aegilops tauschii subsp. strangulata]XP_044400561.1 protein Brevis radix-like 4 isoform X2 [Triticum aestivum]
MLACIACVNKEEGGGRERERDGAGGDRDGDTPTCRDPVKSLTSQLKDMVLKLSGTQRQGVPKRGGSPPPRGRTTSLYRSGYYRPGVVQDDMAVPPATYLGHGAGGGGGTAASSANSTPAWERPPNGGQGGGGEAAVREWVAQVEPGVQITFVSLAGGAGNDLKRIRFSREMYDKWQAQRWWGDNNERIMELYNVRRFTRQVLPDPPRGDDDGERESFYSQSQVGSTMGSPAATPESIAWGAAFARAQPSAAAAGPGGAGAGAARQHSFRGPLSPPPPSSSNPSERAWQQQQQHQQRPNGGPEPDLPEPARTTTSSMPDDVSISNASELEVTEWVIQDEPGVYITVRELADGARELRRVRFSREKFAELNAKLWWEENKERIHAQYL